MSSIHKIKRNYRKTKYILYKETLVDFKEHLWAFIGGFVGIGIIAYLQSQVLPKSDMVYLIGSFGASSVLVYGVIQSPLAQPRNLIGGHVISAIIAIAGSEKVKELGYLYVLSPVLSGSLILLAVALITNNMAHNRLYPNHKKYHKFRKRISRAFRNRRAE